MLDLSSEELQKLVLMLGSKKELGTYLALDDRMLNQIWATHNLKTPLTWLRELPRQDQLELLARHGSLKKLGEAISCSESALRRIYMGEPVRELDWTEEYVLDMFERYKSVRLVAHMHDVGESLVRRVCEKYGLDVSEMIDYSFGANTNAKGRRAELEFARLRGEHILEDLNVTKGSQAEYDFHDAEFGRVNVKSSSQFRFKAQSRKRNSAYWKISTRGYQTADVLICLCYDVKAENLVGIKVIKTVEISTIKTITLTKEDLTEPHGIRSDPKPA